ncbi:SRPBCC family protein [Streptomyces tunisiensis]|uniref:SRPBCC family protein n=1 Tax=Streptomyces tunisiensis TaxID=948699 RepID=UPI003EE35C44
MSDGCSCTLTRTLDTPAATVHRAGTTPGGTEVPLTGSCLDVHENRLLVVGVDVPGRAEPSVMAVELDEDGPAARIELRQTCDTAEERDMAEQGSTMLLNSLTRFLAEGPTG